MMMLEKVEIGGIRGNQLSSQVVAIYEEFLELHAKQSAVTYDALDPEGKEFLVDYEHFKVRCKLYHIRVQKEFQFIRFENSAIEIWNEHSFLSFSTF